MQHNTPPSAEHLFHLGNQALGRGALADAEALFRQAIARGPGLGEAHANLGFVLDAQGDAAGAEAAFRGALSLGIDAFELHMNLGALLTSQKRFEEAEDAYHMALLRNPRSAAVWSNLGVLMIGLKKEDQAQRCLDKALDIDPHHARARFNLAYLHLRQGRFETGWAYLESRDWYVALAARLASPRWQGESPVGKSLLICYEAGHGDVIQFCRYAPVLKAMGAARISLLCHPALKILLQTLEGVDEVIGFDEDLPPDQLLRWHWWTPLLSIPFHLKTRAHSIPARIPYLSAHAGTMARWASELGPRAPGEFRVGLVWRGSTAFENDAERSLPDVHALAPLWSIAGVQFVSLQKGAGEDEAAQVADTQRRPPAAEFCRHRGPD